MDPNMCEKTFVCCYPGCGAGIHDKNANFYAFPMDKPKDLKKWIEAIDIPGYYPTSSDILCSKHFPPHFLDKGILMPNAFPYKANHNGTESKHTVFYNTEEDDYDICRVCGSAKQAPMTDIFDDMLDIYEKVSMCLPIIVNATDNKPQGICDECLEQLEIAVKLINKAVTTEAKLNKLFNKDKDGTHTFKPLPLKGPVICDICDVYFSDMSLFDEHMVEHKSLAKQKVDKRGKEFITCSTCGNIFSNWKKYGDHKAMNTIVCKTCLEKFPNKCSLNEHKCVQYQCKYCTLMFSCDSKLKQHIVQVHRVKSSKNSDFQTPEKTKLENGEVIVEMEDVKPYINNINNTPSNPKKMHRNRREFYHCNVCNVKFSSNKKLREHCIDSHGTPNVLWICKFCGKSMTTKVSLQIHERIHFDSKPYICEWCGNGYRSRANLNQHQVIHTGIRNHECPKCGKKFSRKAFVRTHMRVHTGERPYICDICGHRFTQLGDMKRHRNRHQNPNTPAYPSDRVYACDFCGEHFTQLAMLKKHRLEHAAQPITVIEEPDTKEVTISIAEAEVDIAEVERLNKRGMTKRYIPHQN